MKKIKYTLLRLQEGVKELRRNKWKNIFTVPYVAFAFIIWSKRFHALPIKESFRFYSTYQGFMNILTIAFITITSIMLIKRIGTPFSNAKVRHALSRIGFSNRLGEIPTLLARYKGNNPQVEIMEFDNYGISNKEWQDKRLAIETALNLHIVQVKQGKNLRCTILQVVSGNCSLPEKVHWEKHYLRENDYLLVLGESLLGQETINLMRSIHLLVGGSTGSGKSVLLKLLLIQCIQKGMIVHIFDFKGGIDYPTVWREHVNITTELTDTLDVLNEIENEYKRRNNLLSNSDYSNIDEYNEHTHMKLPRIIVAFDEVAEALDKTGLSKEQKELVAKIESKLFTLARLARACGIHLFLATQRPDATVLSGQIKSNIDMRICGKADSILSKIILDTTDADGMIPKDAQGTFLTNSNVKFQAYLFDEKELLHKDNTTKTLKHHTAKEHLEHTNL